MRRVFFREMSAFLSTPVPYFITGIFLLVSGLFFFHETAAVSLLSSRIAQTQVSAGVSLSELLLVPFFWDASMLVIFLGPLVSQGLYAGKGTPGPAYVFPVSDEKIAFGRYLAALAVLGAMLFLGAFHVAVLAFFTAPDWGIVLSSFLGLLLLGAAVLAMGAFASALARHQASSAALAMGIALVFWTAGWFAPLMPGSTAGSSGPRRSCWRSAGTPWQTTPRGSAAVTCSCSGARSSGRSSPSRPRSSTGRSSSERGADA